MVSKKLWNLLGEQKKYIVFQVLTMTAMLITRIVIVLTLARILNGWVIEKQTGLEPIIGSVLMVIGAVLVQAILTDLNHRFRRKTVERFKVQIRGAILEKLFAAENKPSSTQKTSEIVQVAVEGTEQMEIYYSRYLPQLFYSAIAGIVLFITIARYSIMIAAILFLLVPLIPLSIIIISKFAKKTLAKYWNTYTDLGDLFLESLQGLTTLKIYSADEYKNDEMNERAESFRKMTMKVLSMQLNSITVMDLVAYGGAAIGIILALLGFSKRSLSLVGTILIVLLSSEFFIPMRLLGSYFHIAMNGVSASDKIFALLETPIKERGALACPDPMHIEVKGLGMRFRERVALADVDLSIPTGSFITITGPSGSGKSTLAKILLQQISPGEGEVWMGGVALSDINPKDLRKRVVLIGHEDMIFRGSIRSNLQMAVTDRVLSDRECFNVLVEVRLEELCLKGLDYVVEEGGQNLSGGQRQRLSIARALLINPDLFLLDESTSNIDAESEKVIMDKMKQLKGQKTVISITHRIYNAWGSDQIFVLNSGKIEESGAFEELLEKNGLFYRLYREQEMIEKMRGETIYG